MARERRKRPRLSRLSRGELIAALSAIALFVVMLLPWYGTEVSGQAEKISVEGAGGTAWQALDLISLILMLTVVLAVGAAALRLAGSRWRPLLPPSAAVAVLGGLSALLVLFRIVVPPGFDDLGGIAVSATLELGAFLGLAAAVGIAYGGYRAMGEEGESFESVAERLAPAPTGDRKPRRGPANPASRTRRSSSSG